MRLTTSRAIALLCIPLLLASVSCSKSDSGGASTGATTATTGASSASTTTAKSGGGASATAGATVTAKDKKFGPEKVTVKAGEAVSFKNEDSVPHQPTAGTPDKPDPSVLTVTLDAKETGSTPALKAGTIKYFCEFHQSMVGEITVT